MKVNLLKMQFVDRIRCYSENQIDQTIDSKRIRIIMNYTGEVPTTLTYLTSRIRDKKLKHLKRPIEVTIWNKKSTR
jgi:hypothetical protein